MSISGQQRNSHQTPFRFAPKVFVALLCGLVLAIFAFSQAAASTGIRLDTFRPLGGSFFSWRSAQLNLTADLFAEDKNVDPEHLIRSGRAGLAHAPLSARSLWMIGKGLEKQGRTQATRKVMQRAEQVSRRDAAVQLWLAENAFGREDITAGLAHYDLVMRSEPKAAEAILPRLAAIVAAPEGRRYLLPYAHADNSWFSPLLTTAVNRLPKAEPVGRLLVERKRQAPRVRQLEQTYAALIKKMVDEGAVELALQVYPLLPKGDNPQILRNISGIVEGKVAPGYPPFIWSLANDAYGATLVSLSENSSGMEFYGAPGTVGIAASKLLETRTATEFRWRLIDRATNLQNDAHWVATCVSGKAKGALRKSVNLLDDTVVLNKAMAMTLPENCDVMRIDMKIAGGIGTSPASLIIDNLMLSAPEER